MSQDFIQQFETILNTVLNIFQVIATFVVAFLVVLWLTLCFWTFRDIQARTRDIIAQVFATLLVFFFNIPGVLLYILVRPKETLAQSYERSLQEEYMLQDLEEREICPTCRVKTQPDYLFCFNCRTRLRRECVHCGQLVKLKWASCPYCGLPQKSRPREATAETFGLGSPRPQAQPQPVSTALATTGSPGTGPNLAHSPYQPSEPGYGPAATPNRPAQAGYSGDGGYDYSQSGYNYQGGPAYPAQSNPGPTGNQDLGADIAPELSPDASYEQPTQQFPNSNQPRRNPRRGYNGASSAGQDDIQG